MSAQVKVFTAGLFAGKVILNTTTKGVLEGHIQVDMADRILSDGSVEGRRKVIINEVHYRGKTRLQPITVG